LTLNIELVNPTYSPVEMLGPLTFGRGWVVRIAKMRYRWKVGNGKKIKFREDIWIGSSSLAIQY
jgi:hypothetical protein